MAKNNKEYNDALYQKTYRRNHPDKTLQYRINSNINFLRKMGFDVKKMPLEQPTEA